MTRGVIDEDRLQQLEREIGSADADAVAAIAFAAIYRIGELGREAGTAFARLAEGVDEDHELAALKEGLSLIGWRRD